MKISWRLALASIPLFLLGDPAQAGNIYLDFVPAIQGEATDAGFVDDISVLSASFGAAVPACGGQASYSEFVFTKVIDRASVDMWTNLANGTVLSEAVFRFVHSNGITVYKELRFFNPRLTSVSSAGSSAEARSMEAWSLTYSSVKVRYTFVDPSGKPGASEEVTLTAPACLGP